jgi:hypothetical protein
MAPFPIALSILRLLQDLDHPLPFGGRVAVAARGRQQEHPPLPLEFPKERLVIHFAVHQDGIDQAGQLPRFQPQPLSFMAPVHIPLKAPSMTGSCETTQKVPSPYTHPSLLL